MEKQRDKAAKRMQRKLARQEGHTSPDGETDEFAAVVEESGDGSPESPEQSE